MMKYPERINILELKRKLDDGEHFLLIDLREDSEMAQDGAISGAIHVPFPEIHLRMQDLPKDVEIVFY